MRAIAPLIVLVCLGVSGCSRADPDTPVLLATHSNAKYKLSCNFYGNEVTLDDGRTVSVVSYVTVRDERSNAESRFTPVDPSSLNEPGGFFQTVWSPDEEFLVLPLGRFDGFAIIRAGEALQRVADRGYSDFLRIEMDTGARLWHEFGRWEQPARFSFNAGLSGDLLPFTYDAASRQLATPQKVSASFLGVNSQGTTRLAKE
jgi:hypothetical protein